MSRACEETAGGKEGTRRQTHCEGRGDQHAQTTLGTGLADKGNRTNKVQCRRLTPRERSHLL